MPAQASEDSPEGAAAFVDHYIDVFNHAAATGDVDELKALSSPDCDGCQSYIKLYEDTYKAGGYIRGGEWRISELQLEPGEPETYVTTTVSIENGTSKQDSGSDAVNDEAITEGIGFAAVFAAGQWTLSQFALGDQS